MHVGCHVQTYSRHTFLKLHFASWGLIPCHFPELIWLEPQRGQHRPIGLWILSFLVWLLQLFRWWILGTWRCLLEFLRRSYGQWRKSLLSTSGPSLWPLPREHQYLFLLLNKEAKAPASSLMDFRLTAWLVMTFKHMDSFVFTIVYVIPNDVTILVTVYMLLAQHPASWQPSVSGLPQTPE